MTVEFRPAKILLRFGPRQRLRIGAALAPRVPTPTKKTFSHSRCGEVDRGCSLVLRRKANSRFRTALPGRSDGALFRCGSIKLASPSTWGGHPSRRTIRGTPTARKVWLLLSSFFSSLSEIGDLTVRGQIRNRVSLRSGSNAPSPMPWQYGILYGKNNAERNRRTDRFANARPP
jgi:hypothetical protein